MDDLVDLTRLFTLAVGCVDLGLTVAVFTIYFKANRLNKGMQLPRGMRSITGALPRHIIAVSLGHGLMILGIMGVLVGRIGEDFRFWPVGVALPAFVLSLFGQYEMLHFQRNRVDLARGTLMVTGAPRNDR